MRKLVFALCLLSLPALAGERYLGSIVTNTLSDAGLTERTNVTTAAPFRISPGAQITIQCDVAVYVITDDTTAVTSARGLYLTANEKFPTSVGTQVLSTAATMSDGGTQVTGGIVRVLSTSGNATCRVWERRGNE
jgi:hypothetical protein